MLESSLSFTTGMDLRTRGNRVGRELYALCVLGGQMSAAAKADLDAQLSVIQKVPRDQARADLRELEHELRRLRRRSGAKAPADVYVGLLEQAEGTVGPYANFRITVAVIRKLFAHYEYFSPAIGQLPPHAWLALNIGTQGPPGGFYLLETTRFEDMCALYNQAKSFDVERHVDLDSLAVSKTADALHRATVVAAFNCLEAYINGVGCDYAAENLDNLDQPTINLLTDWNPDRNRGFVSLREKLLQYPKIILGLSHPPLQETNCPELKLFTRQGPAAQEHGHSRIPYAP
ncbi:MAG: hypothetical protein ACRDHX_11685 [Chloroflexota bacterium]